MSDLKSKLPDMNELTSMASKLFKDVRTSVSEIIDSYKEKHEHTEEVKAEAETHTEKTEVTVEVKKKTTKKADEASPEAEKDK